MIDRPVQKNHRPRRQGPFAPLTIKTPNKMTENNRGTAFDSNRQPHAFILSGIPETKTPEILSLNMLALIAFFIQVSEDSFPDKGRLPHDEKI